MRGWYIVRVNVTKEKEVVENIQNTIETNNLGNKIFQIIAPSEERIQTKKMIKMGKEKAVKEVMLYKGYIFIDMELEPETYWAVRNVPGVKGFLGGKRPVPISDEEKQKILEVIEATGEKKVPKLDITFQKEETVRITDGPFKHFQGIVEEVNEEKGKLKVSIFLFGRPTSIELDFTQVEKT